MGKRGVFAMVAAVLACLLAPAGASAQTGGQTNLANCSSAGGCTYTKLADAGVAVPYVAPCVLPEVRAPVGPAELTVCERLGDPHSFVNRLAGVRSGGSLT